MKQLIAYLLDHAIIDFSGDLTLDMVGDFLREDDSPEGRKLLGKLVEGFESQRCDSSRH